MLLRISVFWCAQLKSMDSKVNRSKIRIIKEINDCDLFKFSRIADNSDNYLSISALAYFKKIRILTFI